MNLRKILVLATATMVMTTFLTGCGGDKKADADVIKIGANLEMTGNSATFGISSKNGAELAIKEFNDKGGINGKKIQLIVVDNRSEAAETANAMNKLVDAKVIGIIAPDTSSNVLAAAQAIADAKIPAISPAGSNPKVTVDPNTGKVREFVFRATFIDPFQGNVMANFAIKTLKAAKAAIYIDNSSDYSKGLAQYFKEAFTKQGGTIVSEEGFLQKDTDFKATLTKINGTAPDVIFVPGYYQEVGMIIKQAREMGIKVPIIGGDGFDSIKLPEIAGAANLVNVYFSNHYSVDEKSPVADKFIAAYEKAYGVKPDSYAALGYDAAMMILTSVEKAKSTDPIKVRDEIAKIKDFNGATGKIMLDDKHDAIKAAFIITFKDGKQTFMEKVAP